MWFKKKVPETEVNVTNVTKLIEEYRNKIKELRDELDRLYEHQAKLISTIQSSDQTIESTMETIRTALVKSSEMPTSAEKYGMLTSYLYHSIKILESLHKKL